MTAGRYRKRPVEVDAIRYDGPNADGVIAWLDQWGDPHETEVTHLFQKLDGAIAIRTLEGVMRVNPGDWIIRGVAGELYPIKDAIFRETYEAVE